MLCATRAQGFAVAGTADFFLLIQKDTALEPRERTLLVAGMCPLKTERGNSTACRTGLSIQLHSCCGKKNLCIFLLKGFILALVSAEAMLPMQMEK